MAIAAKALMYYSMEVLPCYCGTKTYPLKMP